MAMTYQNFASLGVNLNRQKYGPLDISNVFTSAADLKYYLTKGTFTEGVSEYWYKNANEKIVPYPYEGQVLATVIDGVVSVYALSLDAEGNFQTQEIGAKVEVDGTTIVKDANGKLSIVAPVSPDSSKTYNFAYANGVYSWVEVDTATAAGQAQEINSLKARASALEDTVNGTDEAEGLVAKVAALEEVDNATQAELDAYKEVVTAAIAAGVAEAKKYADENDTDTVYDDTALAARVKAIEDDYLKEADKYDDTELTGKVSANEEAIADLEEAVGDANGGLTKAIADEKARAEDAEAELLAKINAIDYVDNDELAEAIKDFATDSELADGLALKADKTALEELAATVDAFLTGDGTEAALDSLKELIEYIKTHDDVEISSILASIQAIENKLAGIDSTVVAYVTDAIEALKIEDYAKASDLADLAGRVATLEAKPFDTYATKTEVSNVDAKFANYTTTETLTTQLADKADADKVVSNDTFDTFKTENTTAIGTAKSEAIAAAKTETETQVGALEEAVAETYATKDELTEAVEGIENDLLAYAKTEDVTAELAKKANSSDVYTKGEVDAKIGTPGVPAVTDEEGNEITPAVQGTGVFANAYSRAEVDKLLDEVQGGSSASADSVLRQLNTYKSANDERVSNIETKNGEQDTAIATAQAQADKGVADAAKVASDLASLGVTVADNTREIGVAKSSIETVNTTLSEKITALENADTTIKSDITTLQGIVSGEGGHASRITALEGRATNLETRDTELAALIQGNTDKFADYSTTAQMNKAIQDAIAGADLSTYAKVTDVEAIYKAGVDGGAATGILAEEIARATAAEQANANAISALVGEDKDKTIRAIAAEETAKIVADADTKYDTLKEIADFIMNDETGAAAMSNDIAALKTTVGDAESGLVKAVADNAAAIAAIVQPKGSEEVTVATDGTLGLGKVSTDKLVQGTETLVLDGGSAV